MHKSTMGSNEGIGRAEAAEILGMSLSMVTKLTRDGVLRALPRTGKKKQTLYSAEEVAALKEARGRGHSLGSVADTAQQAWAAARVSQRRVDALERMLGLHVPPSYQLEREAVQTLHIAAEEDAEKIITGADRINHWADILLSMCDQYFVRVTEVLPDVKEPWVVYYNLVRHLLACRTSMGIHPDPEETMAYQRLHIAYRNLRHSTFTYMLQRYGKKAAMDAFPSDFKGEDYDIMNFAIASARASTPGR